MTEEVKLPLNPEEVKITLINQLDKLYMQLINFINSIPINQEIGKFALMNLDQGIMWVQQGVKGLQFEVTQPPEGTDHDASQEDATQASQEERKKTA